MGCGANLKVAAVVSMPAERVESVDRRQSRRKFKLPAEVLLGFQQVLNPKPRQKAEKRPMPASLGRVVIAPSQASEAITTREFRSEDKESGGETLRGFKKNAGIISRKDNGNRRQSLGAEGTMEVSWDENELLSPEAPIMLTSGSNSVDIDPLDWESERFETHQQSFPPDEDWPLSSGSGS